VKLYLANEYVGNIDREQYRRLPEAFVGAKVRTRAYLQELAKEGKIHWTGLTTGPFFDMCKPPSSNIEIIKETRQLTEEQGSC
jgi:hypothetical protein